MENTMDKKEEHKAEKSKGSILKNPWVKSGGIMALAIIICGAIIYFQISSTRLGIDTSLISAPIIALSPSAPGQLEQLYVNEGDTVAAGQPVAEVGTEIIKTKVAGKIVTVDNEVGKSFNPGQAVVSMIDPSQLRVIGTLDENKGLSKIQVGQLASFTVDAFSGKTYTGVVDEIDPTSNQSDVVFNISDQRQVQQFDVKVRFDVNEYPELKNGMSAKLTIFTK